MPSLPPRKFWNLGAQKCSCKHFPWHFSSEKSILGKWRSSLFLLLSDAGSKLMTICVFKHLKYRYSQFKWNKLTSLKCFSPQFIHLILAWFIATNPIFSRDYFLNKLNVQKKRPKWRRGNCLVLPHASYGPVMEMDCSQASCLEEENWRVLGYLFLLSWFQKRLNSLLLIGVWLITTLIDIYTLFNDDKWLCLLGNDFQAGCQMSTAIVVKRTSLALKISLNKLSDTLKFKRFRIFRASLLLSPGTCGGKRPRHSNLLHPSKRLSRDKTVYVYMVI